LKILVTGATGFVGSHLAEALVRRSAHVRCLVRKTSDLRWVKDLDVEYVHGDCCDRDSLRRAVKGVEQVFHLAGVTKAASERTYFEVNALGTKNLLDACVRNGSKVQRFIYLSSQAAAGPSRNGAKKTETDPCEPVSVYGQSKREGEKCVLGHGNELPVVILRPCAVYGPRDKDFYFLFKMLARKVKVRLGSGDNRVNLCYVNDIVRALLLAGEAEDCTGQIFFISDGCDYKSDEIIDILAGIMGANGFRIPVPKSAILAIGALSYRVSRITGRPCLLSRDKAKELVQRNWTCDITRARTVLGFEPRIQLPEGARLTIRWYRDERWL